MMADPKNSRAAESRSFESREAEARPVKRWAPAQLLPKVNEEPGYKMRWIRTKFAMKDDASNVSAKLQEGWEPVKASDHPEVYVFANPDSRFKDSIEIGGLMLCKTPVEFVEQRNAYYQQITDSQIQSVDNSFMRQSNSKMPLFSERQSKVSFGRGS